jgi:hypothetical protein
LAVVPTCRIHLLFQRFGLEILAWGAVQVSVFMKFDTPDLSAEMAEEFEAGSVKK